MQITILKVGNNTFKNEQKKAKLSSCHQSSMQRTKFVTIDEENMILMPQTILCSRLGLDV